MGFGLLAVFIVMVIICLVNCWKALTEPDGLPYGKPTIAVTVIAWIFGIGDIVLYILDRQGIICMACSESTMLIGGMFVLFMALASTVGLIKNR